MNTSASYRMIRCGMIGLTVLAGHGTVVCAGAPAAGDGRSTPGAFTTRLGTFTPQAWDALSGWPQESHAEALGVFQQTCRSLQRRATWRSVCAKAQATRTEAGPARAFFEGEFVPYLVTATERGKEGLMTGYFEPILEGSAVRKAPFVVPVYGAPADLLQLDARRWQGVAADGSVAATIADRQVIPLGGADPGGLQVDPAVFESEPLDRRHRVRREGKRIVPYWTRQQIEAGAALDAPVIAWVDDPQALYLMQVQGSGQIRLAGGKTVRLSYADQNGHPFRPRGGSAGAGTRTRGLPGDTPGNATEPVAVASPVSMRTLSMVSEPTKAEIDRVVDALLAQPSQAPQPVRKRGQAGSSTNAPGESGDKDARAAMNLGYLVAARENDPSYVFFQPAASGGSGPVGALGVPLTATRSIAVDPRSTPLGAPVFIEAERDGSAEPLRRLMIAQDTGGAIRGAVRADFFWGTGPRAGAQALRTKDDLAMWVLLPKDFAKPHGSGTRTRGVGSGAAAECVVPDAEYCLE